MDVSGIAAHSRLRCHEMVIAFEVNKGRYG